MRYKKMSLKNFLFPVALIFAIFAGWFSLWPQYKVFKDTEAAYLADQDALQLIKDKKNATEKLNTQLVTGESESAIVATYLPASKVEEKIIGQLNYLAASAGVFLNNIEIINNANTNPTTTGQPSAVSLSSVINLGSIIGDPNAHTSSAKNGIQYVKVAVSVKGDYAKLKMFFNSVQHMSLLNSIKTLNITTEEKNAGQDPNAPKEVVVSAKLSINFGYLERNNNDKKRLATFEPVIDEKTLQDLKNYVSVEIPAINLEGISTGSSNPFLP